MAWFSGWNIKGAADVWLYFQRNRSFQSLQSHSVLPNDTKTFHSLLVLSLEKIGLIHPQNKKDLICHDLTFLPINNNLHPLFYPICPWTYSRQQPSEEGRWNRLFHIAHKCPKGTLQRTSRPFETQCLKTILISFWKASKNKNGIKCPSIKMALPIVFKLLKISTHECLAIQIGIREYKAFWFSAARVYLTWLHVLTSWGKSSQVKDS